MKSLGLVALGLFVSTLSVSCFAANDDDIQQKARAAYATAMVDYKIPGLVVGITMKGEHHFYATGLASRAGHRLVTPDTLFELGSISKVFNVTLAALAEQRGKLSLNDKVAHYLCADACTIGNNMTLMDLATHHSGGLPLQVPTDVTDTKELVNWLKAWQAPQPGTRSYSNISIGLLGHIAANAMGMSYTKAAETIVFPDIGLANTWINVPAKAIDNYAYGYDGQTDQPIRVTPGVLDAEAYGVKSSARDMLKLLDVELGHGNVSSQLQAAILRTHEGQFKTANFTQDMIWEQYPWPVDLETMVSGNGADIVLHPQKADKIVPALPPLKDVILNKTGSTNGFGGYIVLLPREDLGIVVLANRNYPNDARVKAAYALIKALISKQGG